MGKRNWFKWFPGANLLDFWIGQLKPNEKEIRNYRLKLAGHVAYAIIGLTTLFVGGTYFGTRGLHKLIMHSRQEELREAKELARKLFYDPCYADKNKDRAISFEEKVELYRRMGYTQQVFMDGVDFPDPTLNGLRKAVGSYEKELNLEKKI